MNFLLDTDTCSAHMRRPTHLAHRFIQYNGQLSLASVNLAELYAGAYKHSQATRLLTLISELLQELEVIDFDAACARKFGEVRGTLLQRGISVPTADLMIASTALVHNLTLVTHNTADYRHIPVYSRDWRDGKPVDRCGLSHAFKCVRLEFYDDALNNLETRLKQLGSDESREVNVDFLETFNWLIGLTVQHIAAPRTFNATFEHDSEKRLRLKRRLKSEDAGPYWFRTVTGTTPDGRKTLIIWRKRPGAETPDGIEQDNLVLDEWFTRQGYSSKDSKFDLIYVNGSNNLENLKAPDDTWKVRLIEEDFHRLMFETEDVG